MNYASVCSGAEAFGPAWHELGFKPVFHAEIEPHASAVLRYHYPSVPNYGDFTQIAAPDGPEPTRPIQLLCGGTPCQTYSVAGLREGLDSYKGGLTLEFVKLAKRLGADWLLWENVPGVLSADGGRAFGTFLGTLAECGFGFAYRILDLQNFGCPQRRKRVFLVAHSGGDWQSCAAVLFESESLRGNPAPGRKAGQEITGTLSSRPSGGGGLGTDFDCAGGLVAALTTTPYSDREAEHSKLITVYGGGNTSGEIKVATCLATGNQRLDFDTETFLLEPAIAFQERGREGGRVVEWQEEQSYALLSPVGGGRGQERNICAASAVRRLMPTETEALMGWERGWTKYGINAKGKQYELADGPRYRICGNGWGQPVVTWIAKRILMVDALLTQ